MLRFTTKLSGGVCRGGVKFRVTRGHVLGSPAIVLAAKSLAVRAQVRPGLRTVGQAGERLSKRAAEIDHIWILDPGYAGHTIAVSRYKRFTLVTQLRDALTHVWLAAINAESHSPDREVKYFIAVVRGMLDDA